MRRSRKKPKPAMPPWRRTQQKRGGVSSNGPSPLMARCRPHFCSQRRIPIESEGAVKGRVASDGISLPTARCRATVRMYLVSLSSKRLVPRIGSAVALDCLTACGAVPPFLVNHSFEQELYPCTYRFEWFRSEFGSVPYTKRIRTFCLGAASIIDIASSCPVGCTLETNTWLEPN